MHFTIHGINHSFSKIPDLLRRHKHIVWILFILISTDLLGGIPYFKITSYQEQDNMLDKGEIARKAKERFIYNFGGQKRMILTCQAQDGNIFSRQSLTTLKEVQKELVQESLGLAGKKNSPLKHITQVRSLINAPYLKVDKENLYSKEFIGDQLPKTEKDSELLKKLALLHPEYKQTFLSSDAKYGALIIKTDFEIVANKNEKNKNEFENGLLNFYQDIEESNSSQKIVKPEEKEIELTRNSLSTYAEFEKRVAEIINKVKYKQVLEFSPTSWGATWEKYIFQPELNIAITCMNIILLLIIFFLFRSVSAILWSSILITVPIGWMLGIAGWCNLTVKNSIYISISLVMVAGIADVIHIISGYNLFRKDGLCHNDALKTVFKHSATSCLLTSLTTALGMLSLLMVPIIEIQNMGLLAAFGVLAEVALILFVLPVMMDLWSPYSKKAKTRSRDIIPFVQRLIEKIVTIGANNAKIIIFPFLFVSLFFAYQTTKVQVDTLSINAWKKTEPARKAKEIINDHFGGISGIEVLVETGVENGFKNPEILFAMDALSKKIKTQYPSFVTKTYSIVNEVKYTFQNLNEGRADMYKIPKDKSTLEETLFFFNNANPEDRRLLVTDDYSSASIYIQMKDPGSRLGEKIVNAMRKDVEALKKTILPEFPDFNIILTGSLVQNSAIRNYVSWSQLKSFGLVFLVISILFIFIFRSFKVGLISLIPNIFPIIFIFGLMGWLGIALDETTLMVAPIIIGIVVDDTIHLIAHYRYHIISENSNVNSAIKNTIHEVGQAVIFTSVILVVNFLLLKTVSHQSVARYGLLSAVAVIVALLSDLFLLPALLKIFNADFNVHRKASPKERLYIFDKRYNEITAVQNKLKTTSTNHNFK